MPASRRKLESQEWFSQQLTQQPSPGPSPGCPAGIFLEIRLGLKASMHLLQLPKSVALWSQPWGPNLSKMQNLHCMDRAEERQERKGGIQCYDQEGPQTRRLKKGRNPRAAVGSPGPAVRERVQGLCGKRLLHACASLESRTKG